MMGYRLSNIVTKTGDNGTTQIEVGKRIAKDAPTIHALGDIDELNSVLGIVLVYLPDNHEIRSILLQIQQDLFNIGGELCPPHHPAITNHAIEALEEAIFHWNETLPPLQEFILPGGNLASAHCHLARTVCRRTERSLVHLHHTQTLQPEVLRYVNRLSDLLFILARVLAKESSCQEIAWQHEKKK
jgi:cob(I)alamin adenosyltransferase